MKTKTVVIADFITCTAVLHAQGIDTPSNGLSSKQKTHDSLPLPFSKNKKIGI